MMRKPRSETLRLACTSRDALGMHGRWRRYWRRHHIIGIVLERAALIIFGSILLCSTFSVPHHCSSNEFINDLVELLPCFVRRHAVIRRICRRRRMQFDGRSSLDRRSSNSSFQFLSPFVHVTSSISSKN